MPFIPIDWITITSYYLLAINLLLPIKNKEKMTGQMYICM